VPERVRPGEEHAHLADDYYLVVAQVVPAVRVADDLLQLVLVVFFVHVLFRGHLRSHRVRDDAVELVSVVRIS
jgi:hypothetical protein